MFLCVSCSECGCYTPKKRQKYEDAYRWMVERTANNIRDIYGYVADFTGNDLENMSDKEEIKWLKWYSQSFIFTETHSKIICGDGAFYDRWIFDLDKI